MEKANATMWPMWSLMIKQWETTQAMLTETMESNKDKWGTEGVWMEKANATMWPMWNLMMNQLETAQAMMTETIESNKDLLELNGLWLEKANATWWPVWKKQWETTLLMWEGRNIDWTTQMTEANQWIQKANATCGPSGDPGCPNGKLTKANGKKSPTPGGGNEQQCCSRLGYLDGTMGLSVRPLGREIGDKAWWPMWSMWMKEWKNMMT